MTRGNMREYTEAARGRYLGATKKEVVNLVSHCGESAEGFCLTTLSTVAVCSSVHV
jgi:hypothetical protein